MNWLPLRKNNIPLIDRQVEKALKIHNQIQESIMQGDILSIQKMSEFQLSIKKRVQEIDQFYNKNCLDERVRFLQAARMKLSRIINQSTLIQKQMNIGLPWKQTHDISESRQSNSSSKKSITPRKKTFKTEVGNIHRQTPVSQKQQHKSPLLRNADNSQLNQGKDKSKKITLTLKIPDDDDQNDHVTFSGEKMTAMKTQSKKQAQNLTKSRRKMEFIPSKNRGSLNVPEEKSRKSEINKGSRGTEENKQNNPRIKITQAPAGGANSSRSKITNNSGVRTAQVNNGNSIKLLNDLIFTIKMTKEEYQDFIEMKKQLNQR